MHRYRSHTRPPHTIVRLVCAALVAAGLGANTALAQDKPNEAAIGSTIARNLPGFPKIDEVSKTPMAGLFEVRAGTDIYYSDASGNFLIRGELIDTRSKVSLTQARVAKLTEVDFSSLPLKDAFAIKQGTGARKLAVFADPNCVYCHHLEKDLVTLKDVTIYTFLIPILGGDSPQKSHDIWCAKQAGATWRDWMIGDKAPAHVDGQCDASAIQRNLALAQKIKVLGTPAIIFEDGGRSSGYMPAEQIDKKLASIPPRS